MKKIILFIGLIFESNLAFSLSPASFPVFLKEGFSTVLEFSAPPTEVVLGDPRHFMVQKLQDALVVKPLVPNASSDMFVYFRALEPRLFVLTASNKVTPTFFKRFGTELAFQAPPQVSEIKKRTRFLYRESLRVLSARFSSKKDYLTVAAEISAGSNQMLKPAWTRAHLLFHGKSILPLKLWSERREIQKDSRVKCRFIFLKPNLSRHLWQVLLVIPLSRNRTLSARL